MKKIVICLFILILLGNVNAQNDNPIYSFFAAGHTYGSPNNQHYGLHYPFVDYIPTINNYPNIEIGFLTGDVVVHSTVAYWDSAQVDIDKLNMPVHIAAGNHDMGDEFINRFGNYYYRFVHSNDLFIVLTPGLNSWNISGSQLDFLTNTLDSNYTIVNNIFIFMHELIWWSPDNEYQNININYEPYYPGSTNYDSVIKPLLLSYPNNITIYAGDLGSSNNVSPFMYHSFDNITLIASGMGGGIRDNIIITEVFEDSVYYNLVAINGDDPKAFGELSDYIIPTLHEWSNKNEIKIYPNPAREFFRIENSMQINLKMNIYDIYGQLIQTKLIFQNSNNEIKTTGLKPGIYFLRLFGEEVYFEQIIVIQ